ncbi:MAG: hypothetical protein WCP73_07015 [Eubacteriales bacterium]
MKISVLVNRELTKGEQFAIDRFSFYLNQKGVFGVIGDNAVVIIESPNSHEEIIRYAKTAMDSIMHSHPDFTSCFMDDGNVLNQMNFNVYSVIDGTGVTKVDIGVPFETGIKARAFCLKAAEKNEVVAIAEPD